MVSKLLDEVAELRAKVRMHRLVFANVPDIMLAAYSPAGVCLMLVGIEHANRNAAEGKHYSEFLPEERRERFLWMWTRASIGMASNMEYPIESRLFEATCKPIFEEEESKKDHKLLFVLIQVRDITAHRDALVQASKGGRDSLTGLGGKAALTKHTSGLLRRQLPFAVVFCDLDGFKGVNDNLGHKTGDIVLEKVARELNGSIRAGDIVIRRGGDEFVLVLSDQVSPRDFAQRILHRLIKVLTPFGAGCSIGVAIYPEHGKTLEELESAADQAMYTAKKEGGNCVALPSM